MRNFVHRYKAIGIFSEKSCESYMSVLEKQKERLRGVPQIERRVNLISGRDQVNLKTSVYDPNMKILKKSIGSPRGKYKPRERYNNNTKVVTSVVDIVVCKDDRYVRFTNGKLIPEKLLDVYEWFAGKKAPKEWIEQMARSVPETRSEMEAARERFSVW